MKEIFLEKGRETVKPLKDYYNENVVPMKDYVDENYVKPSKKIYNNYCENLTESLKMALYFGSSSLVMLIHGFIPDFFEESISDELKKVYKYSDDMSTIKLD
jgi:hypothetical protein